ncbi:MAG: hypothetical protein ABJH05_04530 [Fulvivirga sp.]
MKTLNYFLKLTFLFGLITMMTTACKNDENVIAPDKPQPDGEALAQSHADFLEEAIQSFAVDIEEGGTVEGEQGTMLTFYANSLVDADGNDVTGEVDVELIEVFDRASMLLSDKPTQGRQEDGSIATLISGGEFFINATQNGEQLQMRPGMNMMLVAPTDTLDQGMQLFVNEDQDCLEPDCDVVWEEDRQGEMDAGNGPDGNMSYYAFPGNFGWTNIDRWYSDPRPKTTIYVDVPEWYDNTNCEVYITYDGEPTALARFDVYDPGTELFTEHYGLIPIGLEVHFIIVSIVDGQYNYAIQGATIEDNHVEVMGDLNPTTEAELIQMIEDLP